MRILLIAFSFLLLSGAADPGAVRYVGKAKYLTTQYGTRDPVAVVGKKGP